VAWRVPAARRTIDRVQAGAFDEAAFFRAIADSEVRALLIGRRARIALGMPVMTADHDIRWLEVVRRTE
jgi:hypothetical protein